MLLTLTALRHRATVLREADIIFLKKEAKERERKRGSDFSKERVKRVKKDKKTQDEPQSFPSSCNVLAKMTTFAPLGESLRSFSSSNGELPLPFSEVRKGDAVAEEEEEEAAVVLKTTKHMENAARRRSRPNSSSSSSRGGSYAALLPKRTGEDAAVYPPVAMEHFHGENCDPKRAGSPAMVKMAAAATTSSSKKIQKQQQPRMPPPASREASSAALRRLAMGLKQAAQVTAPAGGGKEATLTPKSAFEEKSRSSASPSSSSSLAASAAAAAVVLTYDVRLPAAAGRVNRE